MTDNVHPLLTEDELDAALARLHGEPAGRPNLEAARQALATELDRPLPVRRHRRWGRWASAAAVVGALVAGGLVAENLVGGNQPTASAAALTLRQAATAAIQERDPVLKPGQYLYIHSDAIAESMIDNGEAPLLDYLRSDVSEMWVPADRKADWRMRIVRSGPLRWISGSAAQARAEGVDVSPPAPTDITAACGAFYGDGGAKPACVDAGPGSWQEPTPAWVAALPTDPARLLAKIRADMPKKLGDAEVLTYVADALRAGQIPAKTRATMYQALALLPDLKVTEQVANLDGRKGVAMGVVNPASPVRQEIIVDPKTGQFIGERSVTQRKFDGFPSGAVAASDAITTKVVDGIGER